MMKKKGQGALEYLMTYGWALLIIVVVGAALYALGVLNPATYTQSTCRGFQYFIFQDQKLSATDFEVVLLNGNSDVNITAMSFGGTDLGTIDSPAGSRVTPVSAGGKFTASGANDPTTKVAGDSFSEVVKITYNTKDITGKIDSATCSGTVQ